MTSPLPVALAQHREHWLLLRMEIIKGNIILSKYFDFILKAANIWFGLLVFKGFVDKRKTLRIVSNSKIILQIHPKKQDIRIA